jgi:hypothetical protein
VQSPAAPEGLQALFWQVAPLAHARSQLSQNLGSLVVLAQTCTVGDTLVSLHSVEPAPHSHTEPLEQLAPLGHVLVPAQLFAVHLSSLVQLRLSLQLAPTLRVGVLLHAPAWHAWVVQGSPSSQSLALVHIEHMRVTALHAPVEHMWLARQRPFLHRYGPVQPIWSSHEVVEGAFWRLHPVRASQVSLVQGLPSPGHAPLLGVPPLHVPLSHLSLCVQAIPSHSRVPVNGS